MKYGKLVRDKIPEIIQAKGESVVFHVAEEAEYRKKLLAKLLEEAKEFVDDESPEELADVLEVIECIFDTWGFDRGAVEEIRLLKREQRGGFDERIILDEA